MPGGGKKVAVSSDTPYNERIAQPAKGAGPLPHEVADIDSEMLMAYPRFKEIRAHHPMHAEAGRIFSVAKSKLASYYTRIIVLRANAPMDVPPTNPATRSRTTYDGPLVIGEDLMRAGLRRRRQGLRRSQ